ncbi:calcium-binding protein [Novipirellula artificiosorum]|uniref:Hemolysin, chromosomal n=1 Tax=Novipirellula artificiosorum TaxID=2528016 RepID=A0A5C6D203_9BACT|nr:calcium-binding protein [Novipirellula artificiosorum]TWU30860.1 Hemolysin, chromosomal [Novipirellula artificiosorum]
MTRARTNRTCKPQKNESSNQRRRPRIEVLERRNLFAGDLIDVGPWGAVLFIVGTDGPDQVQVEAIGSSKLIIRQMDGNTEIKRWEELYFDDIFFNGRGGDDTFVSNAPSYTVARGGEGNDMISTGSHDDLIEGGPGNDILSGGPGHDRILGGDGNDWLFGRAGNDVLLGESGADTLWGGVGNDQLRGGLHTDILYGEEGQDWLYGGFGDDFLFGGLDGDWLLGEEGDDTLHGESGADILLGGVGNDRLFGGLDQDWLVGEEGDDLLSGGNEGQTTGDGAHDFLFGGAGRDQFLLPIVEVGLEDPDGQGVSVEDWTDFVERADTIELLSERRR